MEASAANPDANLVQSLITLHEGRIRRIIRDRSGPRILQRMTVDDLFQETVARAVESADGFVFIDDNRFVAWITTIARRVIARSSPSPAFELRTVRLRHLGSSGPGIPQASLRSPARTPSSLASREEGVSALREAMDQLPEHYRKVLTLYKLEERPLADVAREMSRTKGATCRLIARATQELRRSLSE